MFLWLACWPMYMPVETTTRLQEPAALQLLSGPATMSGQSSHAAHCQQHYSSGGCGQHRRFSTRSSRNHRDIAGPTALGHHRSAASARPSECERLRTSGGKGKAGSVQQEASGISLLDDGADVSGWCALTLPDTILTQCSTQGLNVAQMA
jgi:hypothetical protein